LSGKLRGHNGQWLLNCTDDCDLSLCRHLQEHLKDFTGGDMSLDSKNEEEIEFHYFKLHDYDNNNKLGRQLTCVV